MKRIIFGILIITTLSACGPSDADIAAAIAETEAAKPTSTPIPTDTPMPTNTPTQIPPPTNTPTPEPTTALGITFEEGEEYFSKLSGSFLSFEYAYDLLSTEVYESLWYDAGVAIYLMKKHDLAVGIMLNLNDKPIYDTDAAVNFMVDTLTYFVGNSAVEFVVNNFPEDIGDQETKLFQIESGLIGVTVSKANADEYTIMIVDMGMVE